MGINIPLHSFFFFLFFFFFFSFPFFAFLCNRSYHAVTLFGLWVIPFALSVHMAFWRMLIVWFIFSAITIFVMFKATRRKISVYTPRCIHVRETYPKYLDCQCDLNCSRHYHHHLSLSLRLVYRWFLFVYQVTYAVGIIGYVVLLLIFSGVGLLLPVRPDSVMEFGVVLIFYGVYFGVMGRDFAELCVDYMAAAMTVSR